MSLSSPAPHSSDRNGLEARSASSRSPASRAPRTGTRIEDRLAERGGAVELLRLPAALLGAAVRMRGAAYDRGWLPRARLPVPVISVGNLTTGGTGKTPLCAWLIADLTRRGFTPGLLSRGYRSPRGSTPARAGGTEVCAESTQVLAGSTPSRTESMQSPAGSMRSSVQFEKAPNDEALLLARLHPDVPHVQDPDRVRGGRVLVAAGVDAIVLDDGFQHRRLARDLELVLVDATRPWGLPAPSGGGAPVRALLPRGLLREPLSALARADAIVVTRCGDVGPDALDALVSEISERAPGRPIVRARHHARCLRDEHGRETPIETLAGREVVLASAIGNPDAFEAQVRAAGAIVGEHRVFPDHHLYVPADVDDLARAGRVLVTTAKDAVKLGPLGLAFQALEIELEIVAGAAVLDALLDALPRVAGNPIRLVAPRKLS